MSKTIEIASIHKGNINLTVKGEPRKIHFQDKGDVGYAVVDHDEAAVLLKLGLPDFWKPGAKNQVDANINTNNTGAESHTGDGNDQEARATATSVAEKIKAATTIEEVDALAADDERATVVNAAAKRRKELQQ